MNNAENASGEKRQDLGVWSTAGTSTKMTRKNSKRTMQKNQRGNRKEESNDSPEIPDRRATSKIPSFPFGEFTTESYVVDFRVEGEM